jgi:hypothetical protein
LDKQIYIFKPAWDQATSLDDPDPVDEYVPGGKYLLMLKRDPEAESNVKRFALNADLTYYRALGRARGAIQLEMDIYKRPSVFEIGTSQFGVIRTPWPGSANDERYKPSVTRVAEETRDAAALLDSARALCEAVRPANALQKADGLERLKSSPDLNMRQNAETALKILRGEPLR